MALYLRLTYSKAFNLKVELIVMRSGHNVTVASSIIVQLRLYKLDNCYFCLKVPPS